MARQVHFVGSIPLTDAREVFEQVSETVGNRALRIPDGETGIRKEWINSLEHVFADHSDFIRSDETYNRRGTVGTDTWYRYELKPGVAPEDVRFEGSLPQAAEAVEAYKLFSELKREGRVHSNVRYQVQLTPASSVIRRFVVERQQAALERAYDDALLAELAHMADVIPAEELAVQWDVASSVFERLEAGEPTRYGSTVQEMIQTFGDRAVRLGNGVPEGVELLYHLCYGDAKHKHTIEPSSTALMVTFANYLAAHIARPINLIHMPVPRDRVDDGYYEPLEDLKLQADTEIALGLVHYTDGVEGAMRRAAVAKRHLAKFSVATECGFGRRDPATVPRLLEIHSEVANAA